MPEENERKNTKHKHFGINNFQAISLSFISCNHFSLKGNKRRSRKALSK